MMEENLVRKGRLMTLAFSCQVKHFLKLHILPMGVASQFKQQQHPVPQCTFYGAGAKASPLAQPEAAWFDRALEWIVTQAVHANFQLQASQVVIRLDGSDGFCCDKVDFNISKLGAAFQLTPEEKPLTSFC